MKILFSGCIVGQKVNWSGDHNAEKMVIQIASLSNVSPVFFCPEDITLGTHQIVDSEKAWGSPLLY